MTYDLALDWDDTLVDMRTQEWQPGALQALFGFVSSGQRVIVHSCRANWPEGLEAIRAKLTEAGLAFLVDIWTQPGKPHASLYVDNQALRHNGDWAETLAAITSHAPTRTPQTARSQPAAPVRARRATRSRT